MATGAWLMVSSGNEEPPRYWMAGEEHPTEVDGVRHLALAFEPGEYAEAAMRLVSRLRGDPAWAPAIASVQLTQGWLVGEEGGE